MPLHLPKPLFNRTELWYHGLSIPVLFPVGNYLFLGERYFTDPAVFGWATLQAALLYGSSLVVLTAVVKGIFQRYPGVRQVHQRYTLTLLVVTILTVGSVVLATWLFSLFPVYKRPFAWDTVRTALWLGIVFAVLLCFVLGIQYTYGRWQENQMEKEQLKRAALQHDYDALKQQINPHFLFNSLTSLSVLIEQDQQQAGYFVDHLSTVYRYLLSIPDQPLTTLEAELAFINSYSYLLKTRYQSAMSIRISVEPSWRLATLPPLSLQILIDHAIRHNIVSVQKPLDIRIDTTPEGGLRVYYTCQPRSVRFRPDPDGLATLLARYATLPCPPVVVSPDNFCFTITLPLLADGTVSPLK